MDSEWTLSKMVVRQIEKQLKETGEAQVSTSDLESRQIMLRNNITGMGVQLYSH
jgi:hypothetical protein